MIISFYFLELSSPSLVLGSPNDKAHVDTISPDFTHIH